MKQVLPVTEKPLWSPGKDRTDGANLSRFMRFVRAETGNADLNSYAPLYRFSIEQPATFWTLLWDFVGIRSSGERSPVLVGEDMSATRWFPEVQLNFAQNLLRFDDDRVAIRCHDDAGEHAAISYAQLQRRVAALAAALKEYGLQPGNVVAALLPNVPDALIAMLASASLGAIWFSCPLSASGDEARAVLAQLQPKIIFAAAESAHDYADLALVVRVGADWREADNAGGCTSIELLAAPFADAAQEFTALPFGQPLFLTCTTTPQGSSEMLVHSAGGTLIQHLKELVLHADLKREDKVFFHAGNDSMAWYWLASGLAVGATIVLHAGRDLRPDDAELWTLVDDYAITVLGVHGHWLDAAAAAGNVPRETHRLSSLKTMLTAGSTLSASSYDYVYRDVKARLMLAPISTGEDTLACFALGAPVLPVYAGEISARGLGMKVEVLDENNLPVTGQPGMLACTAAFPSMPLGFMHDDDDPRRFDTAYFSRTPGYWCRGDRAVLTLRESLRLLD